jgi:tetratricopeptide (TPR) repeat protein
VPRQITTLQNLGANAGKLEKDRESVRWIEKALALASAAADRQQEQLQRIGLAHAHARLEDWRSAAEQFTLGASIAVQLGDASAHAEALGDAAGCLRNAGRPEQALALINEVLTDPDAEGDAAWRTAQLTNLAEVLADLGQPSEAIMRLQEAANLAPQATDLALERAASIALQHPGLAHRAPELLRRALDLQRQVGSSSDWAWRAATIGAMLSDTSQVGEAPKYFSLALRVFARSGDRQGAFFTRNDRAIALSRIGELSAATRDLRACLAIGEALADRNLVFQALMNLGEIERRRGRLSSAVQHLHRAIAIARELGNTKDEGAALAILGLTQSDRGEEADALSLEAAAIAVAIRELYVGWAGNEQFAADAIHVLGEVILHGVRWMRSRASYPALRAKLINEVRRAAGLDEDLPLLSESISLAEEVLA